MTKNDDKMIDFLNKKPASDSQCAMASSWIMGFISSDRAKLEVRDKKILEVISKLLFNCVDKFD